MPIELDTPASAAPAKSRLDLKLSLPRPRRKVSDKDRMFFTEQLALLLETGTNLHAALQALGGQTENPALQALLAKLADDIAEGRTFSHALSLHPEVFSKSYVALIAASEEGGYMHKVLQQLQDLEEKRAQLNHTLFSALSYPVFLVLFSVAVVVFVLVAVFPKFSEMFALIHDQLPLSTRILMAASEILLKHWYFVLAGLATAAFGMAYWARSPAGNDAIDRIKLSLPLARNVFVPLYFTRVLRVMSLSMANGVPITEALAASREVVDNQVFRNLLGRVETSIEQGAGIAAGFRDAAYVPLLVKQMVTTGEATGNLAKVMARLADFYERELDKKLTTLSRLAEPVMLMVMGLVVGLIVSSLILPIFKLSRAVG